MNVKPLFLAAALCIGLSLPSAAQVRMEMNQITCSNYMSYGPEMQDFVRFWMSGYYNAAANSNVINYDRMRTNLGKVTAYCKKNKSATLPTAIKNALKS